MKDFINLYSKALEDLKSQYLYRDLKVSRENIKNQFVDFSHNDYLSLSHEKKLLEGAIEYASKFGVGSRSSRLLAGNLEFFEPLELLIANSKKKESAIIFNSGFQTNVSAISALLNSRVLKKEIKVFSDRLNHASIHEGIKLAGIKEIRYNHLDMNHLESLLQKNQNSNSINIIISESVFGMDGDRACINSLVNLKNKYSCLLYIDEAHATGLYGNNGYGLTSGFESDIDFIMGTFSKAIGVSGGYLACSRMFKQYLINFSKCFIYSTALSPLVCGAIYTSWKLIAHMESQRQYILDLSKYTRNKLNQIGKDYIKSDTNIIPILVNDSKEALSLKNKLNEVGIIVSAVRPPTVPPGSSRLRIAICLEHSYAQINYLVDKINY